MSQATKSHEMRLKRRARIRAKITGTAERPRLSVFRSARNIYAQIIDDLAGRTLVSINNYDDGKQKRANIEVCAELGRELAAKCKAANIGKVVFDRNGYVYHGRIKALADGAREGGLEF